MGTTSRTFITAILLVCLLPAAPTRANDAGSTTGRALLERGEELLEELEYDLAAEELMRAAAAPDTTPEDRVRAHLLAGIANRIRGRDSDARLNFRNVLLTAPGTRLPEGTAPKVESFFESVRQELAAERAGTSTEAPPAPAPAATPPASAPPPAPATAGGAGPWPWVLTATAGTAALAVSGLGTLSYLDASAKRDRFEAALEEYRRSSTKENRAAVVAASAPANGAAFFHNCVMLPMASLCVPLGGVAIAGASWGAWDVVANEEQAPAAAAPGEQAR